MDTPPNAFTVEHRSEPAYHVLKVIGDIDIFTTPNFTSALEKAFGSPRIVIDLSECRYIDSTGISALYRWQQQNKGKMRLVLGTQDMIRRILNVARVDKFIQVYASVEEAATA
ncbi:MAG: STAS domain-containing protein [Vulcanimicrobiaceae bacterium]